MVLFNKYGFTYLSYKSQYSYQSLKMFILFRILDPVMNYLFYAVLVTAIVGTDYLAFVILGNIIFYTGNEIMMNFMSMFRTERRFGTLELNIAAPMSTTLIILRKAFIPLMDGLLVFVISLLVGRFLFNIVLPTGQFFNLLLIMAVTLFSIFCFSLVFASISLVFSNVNLFLNISTSVLQLLCGAYFSVQILPDSLEAVARFLPLTHAIEALRTVYGYENFALMPLLWKECLIGIFYLCVAFMLIKIMERVARRNGSLVKDF